MTRAELIEAIAALERTLANRVTLTRVILDHDGTELYRIVRAVLPRRTNAITNRSHNHD